MAQQTENIPITISYGHDGTRVLMQFSQSIAVNFMTIEQAEAMRAALATAIGLLKQHLAQPRPH